MEHMKEACQLATANVESPGGGPFGCVIVRGRNRVVEQNDPTAHAEIVALREACNKLQSIDLSDCVVYSSCEPCSMCFSALRWAGVHKIYFSNTREEAVAIGFRDDDIYNQIIEKRQSMHALRVPEGPEAFNMWSAAMQKIEY